MKLVWSYEILGLLFYVAVLISRNKFGADWGVYNVKEVSADSGSFLMAHGKIIYKVFYESLWHTGVDSIH